MEGVYSSGKPVNVFEFFIEILGYQDLTYLNRIRRRLASSMGMFYAV